MSRCRDFVLSLPIINNSQIASSLLSAPTGDDITSKVVGWLRPASTLVLPIYVRIALSATGFSNPDFIINRLTVNARCRANELQDAGIYQHISYWIARRFNELQPNLSPQSAVQTIDQVFCRCLDALCLVLQLRTGVTSSTANQYCNSDAGRRY